MLLGDQIGSSHIELRGFKPVKKLSGKYLAWLGNGKDCFWVVGLGFHSYGKISSERFVFSFDASSDFYFIFRVDGK